jgi:hypothetical protein
MRKPDCMVPESVYGVIQAVSVKGRRGYEEHADLMSEAAW